MEQAARPMVFISHSCKHRQLPGDERLQYAREVLQLIEAALRAAGFDTWVDRDRLYPGDSWNAEIHAALNNCAGAVVLLDPVVLEESDWVLAEATVLAHRYATSADFRLVPILLGGARPQALQRGGWAPLRMADIQPVRENPSLVVEDLTRRAQDVALQVPQAFGGLVSASADPLLTWWTKEITVTLMPLAASAPHRLDAAARALQMNCAGWAADPRLVDRLAFALLDSERDRIPDAARALAPIFNEQADPLGEKLGNKLTPLWVRLEMASGVARAFRSGLGERRMLITTHDQDLASDIIHRAVYCSPQVAVAHCIGESGESLDRLAESCGRSIRKKLLPRVGLPGNAKPDVIAKKLASASTLLFALIDAEGLDEEDIVSLTEKLSERFPGVVLVFLSPQPEIARALPLRGLPVLEPPLTGDELDSAKVFRCQILEIAGRDCPYWDADDGVPTGGI